MKGILNMDIKASHDGKWKSRYWKWGISIATLCLIILLFFTFNTAKATLVDVLNGTGSFDDTNETGVWNLSNSTGTSTWSLDKSTYKTGPGSGLLQSPSGRSVSYDSYISYVFTTTFEQPISATLDLAFRKSYYRDNPNSGDWNVTAEIWQVGGTSPLQTKIINNGNSNVSWTNLSTQTITAITQPNTQYELRLHTKGQTGSQDNAYVKTWFDNVVLNVTYQPTPPSVTSVSAVTDQTVNIVYSEAVDKTTAENKSNYTISPNLNINSVVLQADGKTVQLSTSTQTNGTNYTVSVDNIQDTSGNVMTTPDTATFTGIDTTPPQVSNVSVSNLNTVYLSFNEAVDVTTAQNIANYNISPTLTITSAALQSDNKTVALTTSNQTSGVNYKITVTNVKDNSGNVISSNNTGTFIGVNNNPPTIISNNVINDTSVDVTFSKSLDSATAQNAANYVISPSLIISSATLLSDGVTVRLVTSKQAKGTNYTITVNNVKDSSGNVIAANSNTSFTGVDTTAPTVKSASSIDNTTINVQFSEAVDSTTAQSNANYSISPSLVVSNAVLQADGVTVKLTTASQTSGTTYTLSVNNVKDLTGNVISSTANKGTFTYTQISSIGSPHANFMNETDKCAGCHNSHAAKGARLEIAAVQTDLCYLCHDAGGQSKYDVQTEFGSSSPKTSHHRIPEGTQQCTDCHNPHGATDSNGNTVPALLQNSLNRSVTGGNQFCLTCHQTAQGSTNPINPTTFPADGIGHNKSNLSPTSGTNIRCEGCHEKHASDLPKLLKKNANGDATVANGDNATFCAECHLSASTDGRYQGYSIYNNNTYSKHSLTTSTNTNTAFPGINGQAGQCQNCHDPHGSSYGTSQVSMKTLRDAYTDEATNYTTNDFKFCFNCHNSTSQNNKYDIQTQYTDKGTTKGGHYIKDAGGKLAVGSKVPCEDCHSIHGSANNNKYMMKDSLGSNLGDGRNECLTCHTTGKVVEGLTMQAPPSGVPQHTDNVTPCLNCHGSPHQPTLGVSTGGTDCSGCHSNIATGMKSSTSGYHHLMVNTLPNYLTGANKNCLSCHVDHNKFNADGQKSFNLKQNFTQSFPTSDQTTTGVLNSDFNPNDTTYGGICLSCHKDKQTKTYTQPSGNSETPAISVAGFNASKHNYTAQSTYRDGSIFNADCSKCHNDSMTKDKQVSVNKFSVHDSTYQSILSPFADSSMPVVMNEKFCYKCHDGSGTMDPYGQPMSAAAKTVYTVFASTTGSKHTLGVAGMSCVSCHDPHAANTNNPKSMTTAPAASGVLANVAGVEPTYSTTAWTAPTFGPNALQPLTNEYQLCLKCHSNFSTNMPTTTSAGTTLTNIATEFSSSNPSYHWIGITGTSSKTTNGKYVNGFTASTKLYCTNCHGAAGTSVTTPDDIHGSSNKYILKAPFSPTSSSNTSNLLCYQCHDRSTYGGGSESSGSTGFSSGGKNLHNIGDHRKDSSGLVCAWCHTAIPHGSKRPHLIVTTGDGAPYNANARLSNFYDPGSGRYDKSSCGSNNSQCDEHKGY